jgi:hypothetical protein
MTPVIAVAEHAGRQARFATRLSVAFAAAGLGLEFRTHHELAAEVSVEQAPGQPPAVAPDRPLLWLSPGDSARPQTPDGRFLSAEALAAARSIAFLTRSPVLNRPGDASLGGTFPPGAARAVRGVRRLDPEAVRAERFAGTWPPDADGGAGQPEVYDYATSRSSYGPAPAPTGPTGPFRYRAALRPARLVKVRVVGDQTITTADTAPAILAASRRIAAWYQLDLATVWWLAGPDDGARTLARVDCWLWDADIAAAGEVTDDVTGAVAAWMTERLGRAAEVSR